MANELNVALFAPGLTVTADIYTSGYVLVSGGIACPEVGAPSGRYSGDAPVATLTNETYIVVFRAFGRNVASGPLIWDASGDKEVKDGNMQRQQWKDMGLDPDESKTITENTLNEDYDEAVGAEIQKSVVKVGAVTTIDRA